MEKEESRQGESFQPDPGKADTEGREYSGSGKDSATHGRQSEEKDTPLPFGQTNSLSNGTCSYISKCYQS